jgi:hypothetical protein
VIESNRIEWWASPAREVVMGTKNNPGDFDCYANADPDEPMFILLGRDPFAPALVDEWAASRAVDGESLAKVNEAFACASAMRDWLQTLGKVEKPLLRMQVNRIAADVEGLCNQKQCGDFGPICFQPKDHNGPHIYEWGE